MLLPRSRANGVSSPAQSRKAEWKPYIVTSPCLVLRKSIISLHVRLRFSRVRAGKCAKPPARAAVSFARISSARFPSWMRCSLPTFISDASNLQARVRVELSCKSKRRPQAALKADKEIMLFRCGLPTIHMLLHGEGCSSFPRTRFSQCSSGRLLVVFVRCTV